MSLAMLALYFCCLQRFPIGLDVPEVIDRVPWLDALGELMHNKITFLAGDGQSLPVVGAVSALVLMCLSCKPPVPVHV